MSQISSKRADFGTSAQSLLKVNFLFALIQPFMGIFAGAYITGNTNENLLMIILYWAAHFLGNPITYILNGKLQRYFQVKDLLLFGTVLSFGSVMMMIFFEASTYQAIIATGFATGLGGGFYWSNRFYMTVTSTTDSQRNYFNGLDYTFQTIGQIISPLVFGLYIGLGTDYKLFNKQFAYNSLILIIVAGLFGMYWTLRKAHFGRPATGAILTSNFMPEWQKVRSMLFMMGFYHMAILTLPAFLIMKYVGKEASLGIIDSVSHILAIGAVFLVSRQSQPSQRPMIMLTGAFLMLVGSFIFGFEINKWSVIALQATFIFSDPMLNFPYRSLFMKVIDYCSTREKRNQYAYFVDFEIFQAFGRLTAGGIAVVLYMNMPQETALATFLVLVAMMQFGVVLVARQINKLSVDEPQAEASIALEAQ